MANIDEILRSTNFNQSLSMKLSLNFPFSEMFKAQRNMTNMMSGMNMMEEVTKSLKLQAQFSQPAFSAIDAINKSMDWKSQFAIPKSTIDTITSINRQHEQLFGNIKSITESLSKQNDIFAQINSLQFALSGISGHIAAIAAAQQNWGLLDDFEEVTEHAIEFSNSLTETIDEAEEKRQFHILLALVASFLARHKALGITSLLVIDILLRMASLHQYYDFLQTKPEAATRQDIINANIKQDTVIEYIQEISKQLKQVDEYRITNRKCEVRLKPNLKTTIIDTLPVGLEIVVLQVHHKWIYASYFSPKDNLPQTGWIMKKYLDKP